MTKLKQQWNLKKILFLGFPFGDRQKKIQIKGVGVHNDQSHCAKEAQIVGISAKRRMKFSNVTQWVILRKRGSPTWPKVSHQASSEIRG